MRRLGGRVRMVPSGVVAVQSVTLGGGSGAFYDGLTPTIYAAPTSQGTGSGNSEANAMALETACANAVAGDVVGCVPGVYANSRAGTDDRWTPIYWPANSGSSGSPVIFVGKYDHLIYYSDAARRCEIQNTTANTVMPMTDAGNRAGIGFYGRNYQQWRNFYINTSNVPSYPDKGSVGSNSANNCLLRKIVFNRTLEYGGGDNYDCIFLQASDGITVEYCYAYGNVGYIHRNVAVIKTYAVTNFTFRYNTFSGVGQGIYVKGDVLNGGQSGTIHNNRSIDALTGFITVGVVRSDTATTNVVTVHHNLSIRDAESFRYESSGDNGTTSLNRARKFYKNTSVDATGTQTNSALYSNDSTLQEEDWYDNVVAWTASTSVHPVNLESGLASGITTMDYNLYFWNGSTPVFANGGSTYTGLSAWQTQTGKEANSSVGTPTFDNVGADDYRRTSSGDTGSSTGGKRGCFETGAEQIGCFAGVF